MTYDTFTFTGHLVSPVDATAGRGSVYIRAVGANDSSVTIVDADDNVVMSPGRIAVALDVTGSWSVTLPDPNDTTLTPHGFGYHVRPVLYDGYPNEVTFAVPASTTTLDYADVVQSSIDPLTPDQLVVAETYTTTAVAAEAAARVAADATKVAKGELVYRVSDQTGTDAAKLTAALALAYTGSAYGARAYIDAPLNLGTTSVAVPKGVFIRTDGPARTVITYSGSSAALTWTGSASTDSRLSGGIEPVTVKLAGPGGIGALLTDTRGIVLEDFRVQGNGGSGTTINAGSVGVRLLYATQGVGCSWNQIRVYAEYCGVALDLNGSAFTPTWVTRNEFRGYAQTCTIGVQSNGANSNKFEFHPQNCGTAWSLTNNDGNDIYTYCENNTTDWTADTASINNRVRGTIGVTGTIAATEGTNTRWQTTKFAKLPPLRSPVEWDGNGANLIRRPMSGQSGTFREEWWTRDDTDALVRSFYIERGVASPRFWVTGGAKFSGAVDFSTATVSGIPAPASVSSHLSSDVLLSQSSTALQDLTGLSVAVSASTVYKVSAWVIYDASTTADITFGWTAPSGAAMSWTVDGLRTAATTGTDTTTRSHIGLAGQGAAGGAGVGTKETVLLHGTLSVGGTAGTLQLRAAQNVSEATQVSVYTLSRLDLLTIT